jgi:hypothetical protein
VACYVRNTSILLKNPLLWRSNWDFGALSARRIPASWSHVAKIGAGGLVTSGFMNGARDFARRKVRTALGLERAGLAVMLARKVDHRAVLRQPVAWLGESAVVFSQLFAPGVDIEVPFSIECEVGSREKVPSVRSALSIRFTCGSIPRSSTSHPTISAEP